MTVVTLTMDPNNLATLVDILERAEERCKALAKLRHTTGAEKAVLIGEAAVCQYAYLQIQGIVDAGRTDPGAPDWSAAEASGKLPSDPLKAILDGPTVEPLPIPRDSEAAFDDGSICKKCQAGVGITKPGPPHVPANASHSAHCACDYCF